MKKESLRRSGCLGKHKHATFADAMRQAEIGKRRNSTGVKKLKISAYKCIFCDGYHVGHQKKRRIRKK